MSSLGIPLYEGVVVNNADPLGAGRVKVRIPSLDNGNKDAQLQWCRIGTPFGGLSEGVSYGMFGPILTGSKVVVAILNGDTSNRAVICCLWSPNSNKGLLSRNSRKDANAQPGDSKTVEDSKNPVYNPDIDVGTYASEDGTLSPQSFAISTYQGGYLYMSDRSDDMRIKIKSPSGHIIALDDVNGSVTIANSSKSASITMTKGGDINIFSAGNISYACNGFNLTCSGNINIAAENFNTNANTNMNIAGRNVNVSSCGDSIYTSCGNLFVSANGGITSLYGSSSVVVSNITFSSMSSNNKTSLSSIMPPIKNGDTSVNALNMNMSNVDVKGSAKNKEAAQPEAPKFVPKF